MSWLSDRLKITSDSGKYFWSSDYTFGIKSNETIGTALKVVSTLGIGTFLVGGAAIGSAAKSVAGVAVKAGSSVVEAGKFVFGKIGLGSTTKAVEATKKSSGLSSIFNTVISSIGKIWSVSNVSGTIGGVGINKIGTKQAAQEAGSLFSQWQSGATSESKTVDKFKSVMPLALVGIVGMLAIQKK